MDIPNIAEIEQRAATLREQVTRLNRAHADRYDRHVAESGIRVDETRREAVSARASAELATKRAVEQRDRANASSRKAQDLEERAAREAAKGDATEAAELRQAAQMNRASAAGSTRRANESEHAAREEFDRADRYDREANELLEGSQTRAFELNKMSDMAKQLDQKAFGYEEAAKSFREAVHKVDSPEYDQALERGDMFLRAADHITPDFSGIDTDVLIELGMTKPRVADEFAASTGQSSDVGASLDPTAGEDPVAGTFDAAAGDTSPANEDSTLASADDGLETAQDPGDSNGNGDMVAFGAEMAPAVAPSMDPATDGEPTFAALSGPDASEGGDFSIDEPVDAVAPDDTSFEFQV